MIKTTLTVLATVGLLGTGFKAGTMVNATEVQAVNFSADKSDLANFKDVLAREAKVSMLPVKAVR